MPKKQNLQEIVPVRVDISTLTNIDAIIASGLAADKSSALRVAVAIVARLLKNEPRIYIIEPDRKIFGTLDGARTYLTSLGAQPVGDAVWNGGQADAGAHFTLR